jgi:transcriptional regulator with GAF, ATPase, and Fis domain
MSSNSTGAMQQFPSSGPAVSGSGPAGFVLLYAETFAQLPSAWPITTPRVVVGREPPADIVVPVNAVSRVHAEVVAERGGFVLRDLGSTNGTLVDGHLIREARLEHGQEVRFGDAILKFLDSGVGSYQDYRVDGSMTPGAIRLNPHTGNLIGGYQLDRVGAELSRIAKSELSVMLLGESGTGKEVVARQLHEQSGRVGDFQAINCAAIPSNLLESELFGYKKGAFSGADRDKTGLIQTAHKGTLLLDEIGDMPMAAQAKLLRVLQNKEVFPVGATHPEAVDVRVVCATHRDLRRMQVDNHFRPDLFARLNEYQLRLPPLRDRKEDILLLFRAFIARHGRYPLSPSFRFMTALLHYDWPYNVRELEACAKRCVALATSSTLDIEHLPEPVRDDMSDYGTSIVAAELNTGSDLDPDRAAPTEAQLRALLQLHGGNIAAVGRDLGKARMQVHRWLRKYDITLDDYRE